MASKLCFQTFGEKRVSPLLSVLSPPSAVALRREDHTPLIVLYRKGVDESEKMLCMVQIRQFGASDSEAAEGSAIAFMVALAKRAESGELATKDEIYSARDVELGKLGAH